MSYLSLFTEEQLAHLRGVTVERYSANVSAMLRSAT